MLFRSRLHWSTDVIHFRSRYEAYDRVEGQAAIAEKTAQLNANGNGELSKKDQKEIDNEKAHQLNMRHRGVMQYKAARLVVCCLKRAFRADLKRPVGLQSGRRKESRNAHRL